MGLRGRSPGVVILGAVWSVLQIRSASPASGSSAIEEPSWISPDNCRLYLYRQGADGTYKIYVASRAP
jgi:hypothetical protein